MRTLLLSALVGVIALACLLNSVDSRPVSPTETTDRGEIGKVRTCLKFSTVRYIIIMVSPIIFAKII